MTQGPRRAALETPIGWLAVAENDGAIIEAAFLDRAPSSSAERGPALEECLGQLQDYFAGRRRVFDLRLAPRGTDFQRRVWDAVRDIPFGRASSYGAIALSLGDRNAVRAVGAANGRNPIPVIIPCHRVIGRDGTLVGYGGGLWRKEWLLRHEGVSGFRSEGSRQLDLGLTFAKR